MALTKRMQLRAALLSVGMLVACGDAENETPVDEDIDVTPEEGEEEIIPEDDIDDAEGEPDSEEED
ncbi:hypothetical protein [Planomicrobium sp. CPCC 101079]|uniref:hypothetical protein n=1 Tax=Planomicrobium sp. CPCC 101079 TaxID=2599618 RepID=UPI0011B53ACD|nr:hypothetical protein [Planomicrobium sp. CPCC 101079]TWT13253.1 hypothetical protein FQV28_02935 [Planomicrobium sp. CPCC 101079]